ncbi:MAG: haloacid dehalogenase-like hydrolase, partial [Pseudomonadota bacterium]
MTFDPKTALGQCDTLMLDMDGTVLDLGYDNYMWLEHIPGLWAAQNGVSPDQARDQLMGKFYSMQGDIRWYDLDHWSEYLGVDVKEAHRKERHRIDYLPGAKAFLEDVRASELRVLLVSNSHQMTLDLKDE